MYDEVLAHHGIKGQKWGIRRFQNADGSLTKAGRKRYATIGNEYPSFDEMKSTVAQKNMEKAYDKALNRTSKDPVQTAYDVKNTADQTRNAINMAKNNYQDAKRNSLEKPDVSKMTNKELQDAITRMNLEDNYTRLIQNREASSRGKDKVEKMLDTMGTVAQVASTAAAVAAVVMKLKGM